jgi:hypothetical protein
VNEPKPSCEQRLIINSDARKTADEELTLSVVCSACTLLGWLRDLQSAAPLHCLQGFFNCLCVASDYVILALLVDDARPQDFIYNFMALTRRFYSVERMETETQIY